VAEKSGLSESEINSVIDALLVGIKVVPAEKVISKWKEAEGLMAEVDVGDVPFVAAALSVSCDGIWSGDKHLRRQDRVWTTKEIVGLRRA
jgi:predicted nucleic acid-binding protein